MKIIAVSMEKGGSCKSTVAHSLAYGLKSRGKRVLIVDCDPQCSITMLCKINVGNIDISLMDVLSGTSASKSIRHVTQGLDIIPSGMQLSLADYQLAGAISREKLLSTALSEVSDRYDYCILDTAPSFGLVTLNALTAADYVIIPTAIDLLSLQALSWLYQYIAGIKAKLNNNLKIAGILFAIYDQRSSLTKALEPKFNKVAEKMETRVFSTKIRKAIAVQKSQGNLTDIYTTGGKVAEDYINFVEELLKITEGM